MKGILQKQTGFPPVYDKDSKVLFLGSFPSVKSREISFYYGHKQNRFWRTVCGYFHEEIPNSVDGKRAFLLRNGIALWDIALSCEIVGSSDASIKNAEIADLSEIFTTARIQKIFLNGNLAYQLFLQKYADINIPYQKLPSTSPANPRFSQQIWTEALDAVFRLS
ncbi:MAG: DNA-deoxyinosine glycosylase [Clostridia bacterium]|nr:DNA-deoxyinosine glycosylase [Clostridia bacterium]